MPSPTNEILNPLSLVIPTWESGEFLKAEVGSIFLSGAKLHFVDSAGSYEVITSA